MPVFVGTSGWQYRDWRDVLYPEGVPQRRWLEHYAEQFATVENNGAFYRLPKRAAFEHWADAVPEGFVMAVKASRFLSHVRRLREPKEPVERLVKAASGLGDKLGPILLQLPPTLRVDPELLAGCLKRFPDGVRVAVEARHESWWHDEVEAVLTEYGAALCWADRGSRPVTPLWRTASWGYLRLHEGASTTLRYGLAAMRSWSARIDETWPDDADCFVYFNNDAGGAAVHDARQFAKVMRGLDREVPGGPEHD